MSAANSEVRKMERDCAVHKLVADVAIFDGRRVLLVKYRDVARYDGQRGWFLPDDFLGHQEHPEEAAKRIAKEQAEVALRTVRLTHIESFGNGAWHLIFHYRADLPSTTKAKSGANVAALEWFDQSKLPPRDEFAHQGWAVDVLATMEGKSADAA
jgi:ADP-ribose pyrophosphatase YjhB (NUDIX family)